jgi:nitrite reductase (NADH) large subunit
LDQQTLVVVGNGMTGFRLCRRLVECGATQDAVRLVVFGEEPRPAYDRVRLTEVLAGGTEEDLRLAPASWYLDHGIDLHLGDPVVRVDRAECAVEAASGETIAFDRLVLATGSRPFVPPIPGADLPRVFVYRTAGDLLAIREHARGAARAAILGGGLIGLEAAGAIAAIGPEVHLIEASRGLLPRQLDEVGASLLREKLTTIGVRVHAGARTTRIEAADHERVVCLEGGERLAVDLVVLAAGIRPRGELARLSGIETAGSGGVVVDDHLQSSDPRIFAVGECATHRGVTYGLLAPGYRMVDVLVDNLVGGSAVFEGADRSAVLKLPGVSVAALGRYEEAADTQVHTYLAGGVYRKLVLREGRIVGALSVGEWADLGRVRDAIDEPRGFSFWDLRRFRSTGSLWQKADSPPVYEWAAEALVCGCMGVRRAALTEAEMEGCDTVAALSARTGAGTACGACRPLLVELMQRSRVDSMPPVRLSMLSLPPRGSEPEEEPRASPPTLRCSALPAPPAEPSAPPQPELEAGPPSSTDPAPPPAHPAIFLDAGEAGRQLPLPRSLLDAPTLPCINVEPRPSTSRRADDPAGTGPLSRRRSEAAGPSSRRSDVPVPSSRRFEVAVPSSRRFDVAAPSSRRSETGAPSSRRDTLPPLRPLSVPPRRISALLPPPIQPGPVTTRGRDALLATAVAAFAAGIAFTLAPPVPLARSFRGVHADVLFRGGGAQQASGYGVVLLSLGSLVLSLRKRWKPFSRGTVAGLRVVHGGLGAAAMLCLALHTGLRAGERLNRLLAIDFLAAGLLGGVAAATTAMGDPAAGAARRILATRAHLFVLLPLPVLVVLHVLAVYYF